MTSDFAGKTILVTGATGFIGGYVAEALHALGCHVLALERTPGKGDYLAQRGIEVVRGSITNHERMAEIITPQCDYVVHIAAALSGVSDKVFQQVNVEATGNLARLAAAAGVQRMVYTSSIAVYGAFGDENVDETATLRLYGDPYGDSKIRSEHVLRAVCTETGLDYTIVRPGMVYGPKSPAWATRLANWAKRGITPLIADGQGVAYPVYIDNLVDLIIISLTNPAASQETFNGVDDGPVTLKQFLGGFMAMARTERALRVPAWIARTAAVTVNPVVPTRNVPYLIDQMLGTGRILNDKPKQLLGWQPKIDLAEGLKRTEDWLRAEGLL